MTHRQKVIRLSVMKVMIIKNGGYMLNNYYNKQEKLINQILDRVDDMRSWLPVHTPDRDTLSHSLNHAQLNLEQLDRLASFDDGSFGHDVFGIYKHGWWMHSEDDWLPRCC